MSEAAIAAEPARAEAPWACRGAVLGAAASLLLSTRDHSWLISTLPWGWAGTLLLALGLFLAAEGVRWRWDRLSQSLVGAGGAALAGLGLFLAMTGPVPAAGYPVLLTTAVYVFLRLGLDAGLLVTAIGMAAGAFLGGSELGVPLMICLAFVFFSRSMPSRWQIAVLIGICAACVLAGLAGWSSPAVTVLLVAVPWSLHFGSSRPWRWTAAASLLAFLSLVPTKDDPQTAEGALALAAGLLLLAVPLARRSLREADPGAARAALAPLLAAAVVAIALVLQRGMEAGQPWLGALLAIPLLGWVGWRFRARWLWLPVLAAALAALSLSARGL